MKGKILPGFLIFILVATFLVVACAAPAPAPTPPAPPAKLIELDYASMYPPMCIHGETIAEWVAEVEKRTQGRVKINLYPGGALCKGPDTYDAVVRGIADIGASIPGYCPGRFPIYGCVSLPIGNPTPVSIMQIGDEIAEKYNEFYETRVLYWVSGPPVYLMLKKPVHTLEDLEGMRIKVGGKMMTDGITALGATPEALPMGEAYEALEKGVIDGLFATTDVLKGYRLAEVLNYVIKPSPYQPTCHFTFMNLDIWNSLTPDIQQIIDDVNEEWTVYACERWVQDCEDAVYKYAVPEEGMEIITISTEEMARWKERYEPLVDKNISGLKAKGLPGDEILAELIRLHEKYDPK